MGPTDSPNAVVDSCISTSVSTPPTRPEVRTTRGLQHSSPEVAAPESVPPASVEVCRPPSPPLPSPPPSAAQLAAQLKSAAAAVEQPKQNTVQRGVPRLQMAQPTAFAQMAQPTTFALQSPRPCHFTSSQMQMSPRVVSSPAPLRTTHQSSTVVQYASADAPQVHTVMASPRLLSKAPSQVSAVSVNPSSRGASFQATPRSVSMQSCRSTAQAPLPTLLGVHRCQPEVKSKLLE